MVELFIDPNPDRIVGWAPSTNGILHAVTAEGYYACNKAVGEYNDGKPYFTVNPDKWTNPKCKNCLRKVK